MDLSLCPVKRLGQDCRFAGRMPALPGGVPFVPFVPFVPSQSTDSFCLVLARPKSYRRAMNNQTTGTLLLIASGAFCTVGMVGAKLAFSIHAGMITLGRGGMSPSRPELGWEIATVVIVLAVLGLIFLFRGKPGRPPQ